MADAHLFFDETHLTLGECSETTRQGEVLARDPLGMRAQLLGAVERR
jgi:hypothetical protein